jgi:hypothetical protein
MRAEAAYLFIFGSAQPRMQEMPQLLDFLNRTLDGENAFLLSTKTDS